jgi:DNA-binding winged helix-turn-helix (wHTH) protein
VKAFTVPTWELSIAKAREAEEHHMTAGLAIIQGLLPERDFCLGDWVVQPQFGNVVSGEVTIHLEPKVIEVLVCLATRAGDLVTKAELLQTVWADAHVTEDSLKRCIRELRKAFRDNARAPRFIGTVPTRGYYLMLKPVVVRVRSPDNRVAQAVRGGLDSKDESVGDTLCTGCYGGNNLIAIRSGSKGKGFRELTKIIRCQRCPKGIEVVSCIDPTDGPEIESQVTCPTCGEVNRIRWPGTTGWTIFAVFPVTIQ